MPKVSNTGDRRLRGPRSGHATCTWSLIAASLLLPGCGARDLPIGTSQADEASTTPPSGAPLLAPSAAPLLSSAPLATVPVATASAPAPVQSNTLPVVTETAPAASQLEPLVTSASVTDSAPPAAAAPGYVFAAGAGTLLAVYGVEERVWAVGVGGTLLSWQTPNAPLDDLVFEASSLAEEHTLRAVWAASADDAWAVGDASTIVHWDGTTWAVWPSEELPDTGSAALNSIWGASADDIWAVGEQGVVLHFDGAAWTRTATDLTANLQRVLGTGASDVLIGGCDAVLHYDGSTWQSDPEQTFEGGGNCWQEGFQGLSGELWLTGYWHYSNFHAGTGGHQLSSWVAGEPNETRRDRQANVAWMLADGRMLVAMRQQSVIVVNNTVMTDPDPDVYSEVSVVPAQDDPTIDWAPFLKTPVYVNDLWGAGSWVWAVGDDGFVTRITPP